MPYPYTKKLLIIFLFVCWFANSFAQNQRPKIGLVLSGGGAKGVAHVGILKAMEEAGLTPDYITGTSMGSIVGGLYSIGYSADELKEIVEGGITTISTDFNEMGKRLADMIRNKEHFQIENTNTLILRNSL